MMLLLYDQQAIPVLSAAVDRMMASLVFQAASVH